MPGASLLVVDDDPEIRNAIVAALEIEGYAVATASNGAEALALVERELPSLVLLDMRMPGLGGIAAIRKAKAAGLPVTCDTAPPYFVLNETEIGDYRTFAKLSPPLRAERDRQ